MAILTIRFTPTPEDYAQALRAFVLNQRMTWFVLLLSAAMAAGGLLGVISSGGRNLGFGLFLTLVFIVYVLFLWVVNPWLIRRRVRRNPKMLQEIEWWVETDALIIHNQYRDTRIEWGKFIRLVETRQHYLLVYADDQDLYQALPRRAVGEATAQAAFKKLILGYLRPGLEKLPSPPA